jgi:hypothetical protein
VVFVFAVAVLVSGAVAIASCGRGLDC